MSNDAESGAGAYLYESSPTLSNNTIAYNSASYKGAAIFLALGSPTIAGNTIEGNGAKYGAGLYVSSSSPTIANNVISGNGAASGGGLYLSSSDTAVISNTITNNTAELGGAVYFSGTLGVFANCIIAFNSSGVHVAGDRTPEVRNSCFYGNIEHDFSGMTDPVGTEGNISVDPRLAASGYGNFHIQPDSPCVDAGDGAAVVTELDIDGQPRVQPLNGAVDIGADESDGTTWPTGSGAVIRVSLAGDDTHDGSSWALAKRTVQAGIDVASAMRGEVWVQAGTYAECIVLHPYAHAYGGFAGSETHRDERNWKANTTILDGEGEGSVVTGCPGYDISTIDGFTIANGSVWYGFGGGFHLFYSSPTISSNTIVGNTADRHGGGMWLSYSYPRIVNNIVVGNGTSSGGGLYLDHSSPLIANNTIVGNDANEGGGLYLHYSSPTIANNIVAFNSGGIALYPYPLRSFPLLMNNCAYGNLAYDYGVSPDPVGTNGNIASDPRLGGWEYGNLHIQSDSPCVNAGNNAYVYNSCDMDAQPRIQPAGGVVDMGADESDGTIWPTGPSVIVRVSTTGNDNDDGSSWPSAKRTVQAAVDAASAQGGEVWVQAGTYHERISLLRFAYLFGGFNGTETDRQERDWTLNPTILGGDQQGTVVIASPGYQLNGLDGFTITDGNGYAGGGLSIVRSSPTITHNRFTDNTAYEGGGLYAKASRAIIRNNLLDNNKASQGGGIQLWSFYGILDGNTLRANVASSGGGISVGGGDTRITNSVIAGNGAFSGGGVLLTNSNAELANNTITGKAGCWGGAIHIYSGWPSIVNTIVAFNSSGIRRNENGTQTLQHNCVYGNTEYDYYRISDPVGVDGNISVDPGLASPEYGNVHVQPHSPCIDAGDNDLAYGLADIDDQPRIQPSDGTVDIGADESDGKLWPVGPYTIVRVSGDGNNENDGSSWELAKRTLQAGIDAASTVGGDVWVRGGTYLEQVTLRLYAFFYGGFAGTESARDERDWHRNATIIDGQQQGSVLIGQAGHQVGCIDGFTITNGSAPNGGGIYLHTAGTTVAHNTIRGNRASSEGGGLCLESSCSLITQNAITGNCSEDNGGGISVSSCTPTIAGNSIVGNVATTDGGGMYFSNCYPLLTNTIAAFNSSGIYCLNTSFTLHHNCVFANTAYDFRSCANPTGTNGNISVDPRLVRNPDDGGDGWGDDPDTPDVDEGVNDDHGNLRLRPDSPCIDAGNNDYAVGDLDLDGHPRFFDDPFTPDTGLGTPPIVDIGTYEYQGITAPEDLDGDGDVDWDDYLAFVDCFSGPFAFAGADADDDGDVDDADYAAWESCLNGPDTPLGAGCDGLDLDVDADVDLDDFAWFQATFTGDDGGLPPACIPADFDGDHDVDFGDFARFQAAFTGS